MIKYCVDYLKNSVEFTDEVAANAFAQTHGGVVHEVHESAPSNFLEMQATQNKLLQGAWDFINPYFDQPAFIQMLDWKNTLANDNPIHGYISAVEMWKSAIMFEYLMVKKPSLWAGAPYDFEYSFVGSPPCKFTDLFLMANPTFQAYAAGWVAPDITGYAPGTRQTPKPLLF